MEGNDWGDDKAFFFVGASCTDLMLTPRALLLSVCLFSQGSRAVRLSALSGLSGQDNNLSSIKIAVRLFLLFGSNRAATGERLPGYYLHCRIFSALPCDTVSKQHITSLHRARFLKSALLILLLLHLSISIVSSCLTCLPGAYFHHFNLFFTVVRRDARNPHSTHSLTNMPMKREGG